MIRPLVKVTDWEKVSIGRRLLCAFGRVLILFGILAAIAFILLKNQYSIEAKVWHWRHGNSTTIGGYEIPVAGHWLVFSEDSTGLTLIDISPIRPQRDGKFRTRAEITVSVDSRLSAEPTARAYWKASWLAQQLQQLGSEKVESFEEKKLKFGDEPVICIGGKEYAALLREHPDLPQRDPLSLNCISDGGLNIMFVGEPSDLQPFYTFVSQIRRRN
jgi:hypothetical protein